MSDLVQGFFDEVIDPAYKLWVSVFEPELLDEEVIATATFAKRSKSVDDLALRQFCLTRNHLYYMKHKPGAQPRGVMNLRFVRASFEGDDLDENGELIFKIRLTKNLKYTELFTSHKAVYLEWKELLCPLTIQRDFHSKFNVVKKIGKGAFANVSSHLESPLTCQVYLVERKSNNQRFAVKAFSKAYAKS